MAMLLKLSFMLADSYRALVTQVLSGFSIPGHERMGNFVHTRPTIGIAIGYLKKASRLEVIGSHRLGNGFSVRPYQIVRPDTTFFAREMRNVQVGLNYAHTVWQPNWLWRVNVLAGAGTEYWRKFEPLQIWDDNDNIIPRNQAINARMGNHESYGFFWQSGFEVQHSVTPGSILGIQFRYQHLNHKSSGTAFYGCMWVVSVQWSAFSLGKYAMRNGVGHR